MGGRGVLTSGGTGRGSELLEGRGITLGGGWYCSVLADPIKLAPRLRSLGGRDGLTLGSGGERLEGYTALQAALELAGGRGLTSGWVGRMGGRESLTSGGTETCGKSEAGVELHDPDERSADGRLPQAQRVSPASSNSSA